MDSLRSPFGRTACVCRRCAPRLNHRHADFQSAKFLIRFLFIKKLPGRSLRYLQYDAGLFRTEPRNIHAILVSYTFQRLNEVVSG